MLLYSTDPAIERATPSFGSSLTQKYSFPALKNRYETGLVENSVLIDKVVLNFDVRYFNKNIKPAIADQFAHVLYHGHTAQVIFHDKLFDLRFNLLSQMFFALFDLRRQGVFLGELESNLFLAEWFFLTYGQFPVPFILNHLFPSFFTLSCLEIAFDTPFPIISTVEPAYHKPVGNTIYSKDLKIKGRDTFKSLVAQYSRAEKLNNRKNQGIPIEAGALRLEFRFHRHRYTQYFSIKEFNASGYTFIIQNLVLMAKLLRRRFPWGTVFFNHGLLRYIKHPAYLLISLAGFTDPKGTYPFTTSTIDSRKDKEADTLHNLLQESNDPAFCAFKESSTHGSKKWILDLLRAFLSW